MKRCVPLEAAAEKICNQSATLPLIFQLPPRQGRKVLEEAQDTPVYKYPANISVEETCTGKLLLYYPVTNACFNTPSYRQFAVNYYFPETMIINGQADVLRSE